MKSELFIAIEENNIDRALELIAQGADVNDGGVLEGHTASNLFMAIYNHQTELARLLIKKDADLNAGISATDRTRNGIFRGDHTMSNLFLAIASGQKDIANQLIKAGANVNAGEDAGEDKEDMSVSNLGKALQEGYEDIAIKLIKAGANVDFAESSVNGYAKSNLYLAIDKNLIKAAQKLIAKGADINKGYDDTTECISPLCLAITKGEKAFALKLIDAGADPHFGVKAKKEGPSLNGTNLLTAMMQDYDKKDLLDIVLALISKDGHLYGSENNLTLRGTMPNLFFAISQGKSDIAMALIQNNVNLNSLFIETNGNTTSCLYIALQNGKKDIALALIDAGADLTLGKTLEDDKHVSCLQVALEAGDKDIAKVLIEEGAPLSAWTYNLGIKDPEIAKALLTRLYGGKFPSLFTLCMFKIPALTTDSVPESVATLYNRYAQDKEFLMANKLNDLDEEVANQIGAPINPLSMFS